MAKLTFDIDVPKKPQKFRARWHADVKETKERFVIAETVGYTDADGKHRGLYQDRVKKKIPQLRYDRATAEKSLGLWAHFIWPSVTAESGNGHHLIVNTYDRARFTFGFYQLAAHTPDDNLIKLFQRLVALPTAVDYFPDLLLSNKRLHRKDGSSTYSLEKVTKVHRPNGKKEDQLVTFMTYLNPDTQKANAREALNAAKLMHWLVNDPDAETASVEVAFEIMHGKIKSYASAYGLAGKDPRLAIWVSDIRHQGRGGSTKIKAALAKPTVEKQLKALSKIDKYTTKYPKGQYRARRKAVQKSIDILTGEKRFDGVVLGDGKLPL